MDGDVVDELFVLEEGVAQLGHQFETLVAVFRRAPVGCIKCAARRGNRGIAGIGGGIRRLAGRLIILEASNGEGKI